MRTENNIKPYGKRHSVHIVVIIQLAKKFIRNMRKNESQSNVYSPYWIIERRKCLPIGANECRFVQLFVDILLPLMQKSLMNVLNTRMIADSFKWMYFHVNEITIRVNTSIFSVNDYWLFGCTKCALSLHYINKFSLGSCKIWAVENNGIVSW